MVKKEANQKPFKVAKWIMLSFAILLNSFIIFYSCLDDKTTNDWSRFVSNVFTNVVNTFTHKDVKVIRVEHIATNFTNDEKNNVPGYELNEIPLGCEKVVDTEVLPENATNKAITYKADSNGKVTINQNGTKASLIGMETGDTGVVASWSDKEYSLLWRTELKVVDLRAPVSFDANINNTTIPMGSPETVNVVVTNAFDDELKDSLYYDVSKLSYTSDDDSIATVGSFGVITPVSTGSTTIRVSNNNGVEKSFNITVIAGSPAPAYENLSINGGDTCYENDIFSNKKVSLSIKSNETTLENSEFIWQSSNPLLVRVNQKGEVYGYRKTSLQDETVTIRAINKKTQQEVTKEITIKKELPTKLNTCYVLGDKELWDHPKVTAFVGDVITVNVSYDKTVLNKDFTVTSSNEEVVKCFNQGNSVLLEIKKEGTAEVTITSNIVTSLKDVTEITVKPAGAINKENYEDVNLTIRKSIGHALLFAITQVFTFLALYMFLPKMKWWQLALISLGIGLFIASISELIQFFIPLRSGKFIDVLIDAAGIVTGLAITLGILILVKDHKNKKEKKS